MVRYVILLGFLLRLGVAAWNGFAGPSFGAEGDAAGLHVMASDFARGVPTEFKYGYLFAYALGLVYILTTDSLFLGSVLSCLAWLASAWTLMATMRLLAIRRSQQIKAMLIFALLPSALLWTSVTLREPYQLLCVTLSVYSSLLIYLRKATFHWLLLICLPVVGGLLHPGLFGFGVFVLVATSVWLLFRRRHRIPVGKVLLVVPFAAVVLWYGYWWFTNMYSFPLEEGLGSAVESYQRGGLSIGVRTDYRTDVAIDGTMGLLLFLPVCLLQYLFEPMPWRMGTVADVVPLLENILRVYLLWKAFTGLRHVPSHTRRPLLLVFASYLVLETAWSLGTFNWGTSARHHIPAMGLLVTTAFAYSPRRGRQGTRQPGGAHVAHAAA